MDWVERPWTVQSPRQLDPDWRVALDRYEAGSQPWSPRIFVPTWKRDKRNKSKESTWLIADGKDGLSVLEKPHDGEFVSHQIAYRDAILVEEGTALLLGWIGWRWMRGRSLGRIRIEFHSSLEPAFHRYATQMLRTWGLHDPRTELGDNPQVGQGEADHDLYRQLLDYHIGPKEAIESLVYQPRVLSRWGMVRKRQHTVATQHMAVRTPFRWILMSDSDGIHDLEYGTGIVSLARSQWSVMALSRDLLEWSPIQGGAEGKIKMSFPGRALQFVDDGSKSVLW
ncbi:MAG: hypothetical protein ABSH28_21605 [Acidobacteriota bacterium]|jgi:hypothetical protein